MALSRKKKIIIGAAAGVLVLIVIIISIFATRTDTPEVTVVKVETRKELRSTVTSSGEVRPIQFMNLTSEVQGRIEEIYVKEGDHVTKGQPLVSLDPNQLQSNTDAQMAAFQARARRGPCLTVAGFRRPEPVSLRLSSSLMSPRLPSILPDSSVVSQPDRRR